MPSETLTIGVDFGTTFSSVAYSINKNKKRKPVLVTQWGTGPSTPNVPTLLRYANKSGDVEWGLQVTQNHRPSRKTMECFKLVMLSVTWPTGLPLALYLTKILPSNSFSTLKSSKGMGAWMWTSFTKISWHRSITGDARPENSARHISVCSASKPLVPSRKR